MTQPNFSSNERITSSGIAEPPDAQVRSVGRVHAVGSGG
jgi:hypothetical protein